MLPKSYRLPLRREFRRLRKEGKLVPGKLLSLVIISQAIQADSSGPRFGFIVSKKIYLKASRRNYLKRRLQETIQKLLPKIKGKADILVLTKKAAATASNEEIFGEIEILLGKAGLLT